MGGRFGLLGSFDFWPPRREVFLQANPQDVLDAVLDRGITRLAIPDGPATPVSYRTKEREAALDLWAAVFAYGPNGKVAEPDLRIRGTEPAIEANANHALRPERDIASLEKRKLEDGAKETDRDYVRMLLARKDEVSSSDRARIAEARQEILHGGNATEDYRRIAPAEALHMLVG